jgi:hypothetical protein
MLRLFIQHHKSQNDMLTIGWYAKFCNSNFMAVVLAVMVSTLSTTVIKSAIPDRVILRFHHYTFEILWLCEYH